MFEEVVADGVVEGVDHVVRAGEQHRHGAGAVGVEPAFDGGVDERGAVVGDDDAFVGAVGVDGGGDVPVAQVVEGVDLPGGVLAPVDGQLGDGEVGVGGEGGEPAAGGDLGELVVVADEQHPAAGGDDAGGDVFEVADAGHAGFVDDQHGAGVGEVVAAVPAGR